MFLNCFNVLHVHYIMQVNIEQAEKQKQLELTKNLSSLFTNLKRFLCYLFLKLRSHPFPHTSADVIEKSYLLFMLPFCRNIVPRRDLMLF